MNDDRNDAATSEPTLHDELSAAWDELHEPETTSEKQEPEIPQTAEAEEVEPDKPAEVEADATEPKKEESVVVKAPASWKPEVREKFAELPEEVRNEIMRVDGEVGKINREFAQARQMVEEVASTIKPYQEIIQAAGTTPLRAVQETLEVAKRLVTGSPRQKAEVLRELVQVYSIDINELDNVLTEHMTAPKATPTEKAILHRLDRFEQQLSPRQNSPQMSADEQAAINSVKEFAADPKNEFFNDVWQDMEMLLTSQRASTIQDAYDKACRMNDSVSKVLEGRKAKDKQRVAAGNVSVKGSAPKAKSNPDAGKSLRDVLSDAYDEVMGG